MEGAYLQNAGRENRYLYNGKELDTEFGLNWYHYGARMYDPAVGRFTGVDPIADKFAHITGYNYAENRVPNGIDLHGLQYVPFNSATFQMAGYDKEQHKRAVQGYLQGQKELGSAIVDEIPFVGEAKAIYEGDVAGVLLAMIPGGGFFKKGKNLLKKNREIGKKGEKLVNENLKDEFLDDEILEQVTGRFDDGSATRFDDVIIDENTGAVKLVNETKTGDAKLSGQQKRFFEKGESVTLKGKNAGVAEGQQLNVNNTNSRVTRVKREDLEN